ncbi:FAD/NAD(P)-binding domain-containing protein [Neoconidiobolus thromboides FSU 785]|nr:FAD/NAD(P)-binding domain-containing protein [Neoconidiobolus thromboides FSU 785]
MTKGITRIAIVGGNYGGLGAAYNLVNFFYPNKSEHPEAPVEIRLYDKRQGFVHLIGMTRGLTGDKLGPTLYTPHIELPYYKDGKVEFIYKKVTQIFKNHLITEDGQQDPFDYLILATGYLRGPPIWPAASTHSELKEELLDYAKKIEQAKDIVVVGGGAVGVEMACDIACHFKDKKVSLLHSRELPIPGPFTDEFRNKVVQVLEEFKVNLLFKQRLLNKEEIIEEGKIRYKLTTSQNNTIECDMVIECTGFGAPNSELLQLDNVLDEKKLVKIRPTLQLESPKYSHIYAIGDVNNFQEIKLAGGAMYQGMYAARSIHQLVVKNDDKLEEYPKFFQHLYLLLGPGKILAFAEEGILTETTLPNTSSTYLLKDMGRDACKAGLGFEV